MFAPSAHMTEFQCDPEMSSAASKPPDRRNHPRLKCRLAAEIRTPQSRFPLGVETTDVSLGGCYVATMFPLAAGTKVDFRCWIGTTAIACKAVIRTSDPNVGNGIAFLDLDELSRAVLANHLEHLQADDAQVNDPIGVIHTRRS
jgi:hypothetical protein